MSWIWWTILGSAIFLFAGLTLSGVLFHHDVELDVESGD